MPSLRDATRTAGFSTRGYANAYAFLTNHRGAEHTEEGAIAFQ
ncbi:hypothetical protein [Nostoc sp.]